MNTLTPSLAARASGIVAVALLLLLAPTLPAGAQGTLSLSFASPYYVVNTSNEQTRNVPYMQDGQVIVSPASAEVECTPEVGSMFPRGATKVDCTARLGKQTKTGSFYVLVAKGDDTDIQLGPITQDPSPVEPAGFVTYNVEYRPIVPTTANIIEVSTTLPPQVSFYSKSSPNCDTSKLPTITCRIFSVREPGAFQITVQTKPPFQGTYAITWSMKMAPNDSGTTQRDLFAGNNTASITTEVRVAQAPNQLFLPILIK